MFERDIIIGFLFSILLLLHISWIVLFFYPSRRHQKNLKKTKNTQQPKISVIIPAHNEAYIIEKTIKHVLLSDYNSEIEVIVVDDGSTDNTSEIVTKISKRNKNVKLLQTPHCGKASAINKGMKFAKNDILIVLDADSIVEKDCFKKLVNKFEDEKVAAVSGIIRAIKNNNPLTWFQDFEYMLSSTWRFLLSKIDSAYILPGFAAFRKKALEDVNYFSADTFAEDFDIGLKLRKKGYKIEMSNATIYTRVPETITGLIKQRLRWGRGTIDVIEKHRDILFNLRYKGVGIYGIPTQIFWFIHGLLYIPIAINDIFGGYVRYYLLNNTILSLDVIRYFIAWFSMYGMIEYTYRTLTGVYQITLIFYLTLFLFILYQIFNFLVLYRFREIKLEYLFVIFFYFPYCLFTLSLHTIPLIFKIFESLGFEVKIISGKTNVWSKSL